MVACGSNKIEVKSVYLITFVPGAKRTVMLLKNTKCSIMNTRLISNYSQLIQI